MPAPSKPPRPQYCVRKTRPLAFLEMTRMISSFHRHGRPGAEEGLPIQFLYKPWWQSFGNRQNYHFYSSNLEKTMLSTSVSSKSTASSRATSTSVPSEVCSASQLLSLLSYQPGSLAFPFTSKGLHLKSSRFSILLAPFFLLCDHVVLASVFFLESLVLCAEHIYQYIARRRRRANFRNLVDITRMLLQEQRLTLMHVDPALAAYLIVYKNKISTWNLMTSRRYPNWTLDHSWRLRQNKSIPPEDEILFGRRQWNAQSRCLLGQYHSWVSESMAIGPLHFSTSIWSSMFGLLETTAPSVKRS